MFLLLCSLLDGPSSKLASTASPKSYVRFPYTARSWQHPADTLWSAFTLARFFFLQLLLVDSMASSREEEAVEAAEIMQNQIYYNGDILEMAHTVVLRFKDQSIAYVSLTNHISPF